MVRRNQRAGRHGHHGGCPANAVIDVPLALANNPDRYGAVDGVHEVVVDSTDEVSVRALFESVGELDHLLVTASPGQSGVFLEQDLAHARTFMDGKFFGSWTCARYAAPRVD